MARGWGRNEEDLGAEKEQAREARSSPDRAASSSDLVAAGKRRSLELSLARIEELLVKTSHPARRAALELAKGQIHKQLEDLDQGPGSSGR